MSLLCTEDGAKHRVLRTTRDLRFVENISGNSMRPTFILFVQINIYPSCQLCYELYRRNYKIRTGLILSFEIISWNLFPLLMKGASSSETIYDVHQ